ncbi:tyrosine-protein phosphatase [Virgibacillus siamensis]|uniref:tyrosine-protein phosphatase n=1 Tax=Virgibacillus siamensis TaxID=480071 RepID=UPI000987199F|nr:CpsB/CapC family capsule biosynthesis tyrosine phosphatase [Virgibacillus siamensis]
MIDIHCHILPGIDDGAATLDDSINMAKEAAEQGITKIAATPHHKSTHFDNYGQDIIGMVAYLNGKLQEQNIPVEILPGQETRVYGEMVEDLKKGEVIPINGTQYVLVEFPHNHVPNYARQLLFDLQIAGYKPVIVHPERNTELQENTDKLYRMVKSGALTQITAGSLLGKTGKRVQKFADQLVEANLTHFIASDAHDIKKRTFHMREAFGYIRKQYGKAFAYQLMENNELLILGHTVNKDLPERIAHKKKWSIFG